MIASVRRVCSTALCACYDSHIMAPRTRRRHFHPDTLVLLRQLGVGLIILIVLIALSAAVWYGTRLERFTIDTVTVRGGETIAPAAIEARVSDTLTGAYAGLVPRRFTWLYPRDAVAAAVQAEDRVDELTIKRSGTSLTISFTEHVPTALWCAGGAPPPDTTATDPASCLFLDREGFAFAHAPPLTGSTFLRYHTLERDPARRERPLPPEQFAKAGRLAATLRGEGLFVTHIEIDSAGDAYFHLARGSELWIALRDEPARVLENLLTILESEEFGHLEPGDFRYIDLRFGNKVYVNDEPWPTGEKNATTSTATSSDVTGE